MAALTESLELFIETKNGFKLFYDLEHSHLATHLKDTPQLKDLLVECFDHIVNLKIKAKDTRFCITYDFGRVIGKSDLVEIKKGDEIVYARRTNRDTYAVFAKNRQPVDVTFITAVFNRVSDEVYELYSAWVGDVTPAFPGDKNEDFDSRDFWSKHALAWGNQEIQSGTETTQAPW